MCCVLSGITQSRRQREIPPLIKIKKGRFSQVRKVRPFLIDAYIYTAVTAPGEFGLTIGSARRFPIDRIGNFRII